MVSLETTKCLESSSPRISFSSEFLDDDDNFITICPNPRAESELEAAKRAPRSSLEFEFRNLTNMMMMSTADELFSEGKLLPFCCQMHHQHAAHEKTTLKNSDRAGPTPEGKNGNREEAESRVGWFLDDDPSPRPPKCTLLWKELLRLKKQHPRPPPPPNTTLSPCSSYSSSSSRSRAADHERKEGDDQLNKEKSAKRMKRAKSIKIRIRPVINVPICTQARKINTSLLPPLFPLNKGSRY